MFRKCFIQKILGILMLSSLAFLFVACPIQQGVEPDVEVTLEEDVEKYIMYESDYPFSIKPNKGKTWNGELYYTSDLSSPTWKVLSGNRAVAAHDGNSYKLYVVGKNNTVITGVNGSSYRWIIDGKEVKCSGDIRALLHFPDVNNTTMGKHCFSYLFETPNIVSAPDLPATTLGEACYYAMFNKCTSLKTPPALPATVLSDYCYGFMFSGCTSLTSVPALPATNLVLRCYISMFNDCTSLKFSEVENAEKGYTNAISLGTGDAEKIFYEMLLGTGGDFTGDPESGDTIWTTNPVVQ